MDPRKTFPNLRLSVASQFVWCTASQRDHSKLKRTQTRNRVVTIAAICTRNSARVNDEMSKHSTAAQRAEWHLKRVASFEETENLYRLTYVWPEAWKWYALLLRKFKETRTSSMGNKDVCINLQLHFALDGDTQKNHWRNSYVRTNKFTKRARKLATYHSKICTSWLEIYMIYLLNFLTQSNYCNYCSVILIFPFFYQKSSHIVAQI